MIEVEMPARYLVGRVVRKQQGTAQYRCYRSLDNLLSKELVQFTLYPNDLPDIDLFNKAYVILFRNAQASIIPEHKLLKSEFNYIDLTEFFKGMPAHLKFKYYKEGIKSAISSTVGDYLRTLPC